MYKAYQLLMVVYKQSVSIDIPDDTISICAIDAEDLTKYPIEDIEKKVIKATAETNHISANDLYVKAKLVPYIYM